MNKDLEKNNSLVLEKDRLPASFYNTILPVIQCPHCGLELSDETVWNHFKAKEMDPSIRSKMVLFDSLLHYPMKDLELFEKQFATLRYCCKINVLNTYLNVKRLAIDTIKLLKDESTLQKEDHDLAPLGQKIEVNSSANKPVKKRTKVNHDDNFTENDFEK